MSDIQLETGSGSSNQLISEVKDAYKKLHTEVSKIIVGQEEVLDQVFMSLFCNGHALLVGVPGLAKTLLISTISEAIDLSFNRIQFTPDLMPSDITGTEVIEENKSTGTRELRFVQGPIFANIVLADEINRTPPKTQAALLEAMQERHVTANGKILPLPKPFFVLATQNPIEQEGTYPLPEAQLDRFMFMIKVGYPTHEEELEIVRRTTASYATEVSKVLDGERVMQIQKLIRDVPVPDHVIRYVLNLVRATREPQAGETDIRPEFVKEYIGWGAGPRACQNLVLAGKARAVLHGRTHVEHQDIAAVIHPVMRHRLIANFNAEADGITVETIIDKLLAEIKPDSTDSRTEQQMDRVLR